MKRLESDTYIDSTNRTFIIFITEVSLYSFLVEYLHQQFHLKRPWLIKYKWFQKIKRNHLLHHVKQETNFSFFSTTMDKLQNTYLCNNERFNTVISNS